MAKVQRMVSPRTITGEDQARGARAGRAMSGLDYLKAMQEGRIPPPPIAMLIDMRIVEVSEGRVVFAAQPAEFHYNPLGAVHGGLAATLLDSALGCAIHSTLPAGTSFTTLEIQVNYLRPMRRETGLVYSEGKVIHGCGRVATAEGSITEADGKLYAYGTTTCIILRS